MRPNILFDFRILFSTLAFIAVCSKHVAAAPNPVSVYFDDQFRGDDGKWSAAQIRVGTPEQYLSLLPSTASSETWVVDPNGCDGTLSCQQKRGGLFYKNTSTTWDFLGSFEIGYKLTPDPLAAQYGLDSIAISDSLSTQNQSVAIFASTQLFLGSIGLNVKETRYNNDVSHLSFISSLVHNKSAIPSHSYGYTAGAYYSQKSISGSLTLGGTDTTRYVPNSVSFPLGSETYSLNVGVKSVRVASSAEPVGIPTNWNSNPVTLMPSEEAAFFTIDSSTPFLWMPAAVCDSFAAALNLTYDQDLDLYVFAGGTSPQNLTNWNLSFTFTLVSDLSADSGLDLTISYNAFNLQLEPYNPVLGSNNTASRNYFPLRRANSSLEYIIGRAFLQETYLTVDYERGNFSVSTAIFPDTSVVSPNLVPISRPANSIWPAPQQSQAASLTNGQKAGIAIGVCVAVVILAALLCFGLRRRTKGRTGPGREKKRSFDLLRFVKLRKDSSNVVTELPADKRHPREMQADASNTRFELAGGNDPVEMPAGEVSSFYLAASKDDVKVIDDSDASTPPAKPEKGQGPDENGIIFIRELSQRSQSPVPPYSATEPVQQAQDINNSNSNSHSSSGISPSSMQHSHTFGTNSSGEQGISPITQFSPMNADFTIPEGADAIGPITQNLASARHTTSMSVNSQTRRSMLNSPRTSESRAPTRTESRNSRFREELDEVEPEPTEGERPKLIRQRFSWEE